MAFTEVFPFQVVQSNHLQLYQVALTNWGMTGTGADANSLVSPILRFPLASIAVDPESTVERAILRASQNGQLSTAAGLQAADMPLDQTKELAGRLSFPRIARFDGGWGLVASIMDRYGDSYTDVLGAPQPFGDLVASPAVFEKPELRLIMGLDAGLPFVSIPKRYPVRRSILFSISDPGELSVRFLPIAGRKTLRVSAVMLAGVAPATLHIRGISAGVRTGVFPPQQTPDLMEFPLVAPLAVPAFGAPSSVTTLITDPTCHYLHLLVEGDASQIEISVEARD